MCSLYMVGRTFQIIEAFKRRVSRSMNLYLRVIMCNFEVIFTGRRPISSSSLLSFSSFYLNLPPSPSVFLRILHLISSLRFTGYFLSFFFCYFWLGNLFGIRAIALVLIGNVQKLRCIREPGTEINIFFYLFFMNTRWVPFLPLGTEAPSFAWFFLHLFLSLVFFFLSSVRLKQHHGQNQEEHFVADAFD